MKLELDGVAARHPAARPGAAPALQPLRLQVAEGEHVAVIGPSGAGKTTLLMVLACAMPPAAGTLQVGGQNPWVMPRRALQRLRGRLFLAPQTPPLPPRQRVVTAVLAGRLPSIGLWASLRSLFYPSDIPAAHAALEAFDLADKLFERVDRLSGGERQRVGLARALLAPAALWLVDEPLSALDPTRSRQAMQTLVQQAQARGVTLVATLHHVEMALKSFPRIIGMRDGQVAFDLPAPQVSAQHLQALYAQHLHELDGPALTPYDALDHAADHAPSAPPLPVVMHCR